MTRELPALVAIVGPTGSGKSDLALDIAETFKGEIVNCDSLQIYRHLNIGTAKTPPEERRGIPHHLIDILDPDEDYTAGDYARAARTVLGDIAHRGRLPVVAGGTGFYLRALLHGLFEGPARDPEIRVRLIRRKPESLHRLLRRFDPAAADRIHPRDAQKLVRALEVCLVARSPLTELQRTRASAPLAGFRLFKVGVDPGRDALRERLRERSRRMFEIGLVHELCDILTMGFPPSCKALQSIGYKEAGLLLSGGIDIDEAIELTFIATAQYAKRQRTWFRRESDITWFSGFGSDVAVGNAVKRHLDDCIK